MAVGKRKNGTDPSPVAARRTRRVWLWALAVLLLLGSATAALAYYIHVSQTEGTRFRKEQVSCQVSEKFQDNQKTSIAVKNTSTVPAYIRVRLVSYWQTPSGKIAGRTAEVPPLQLADGWIGLGENTYCYRAPVEAGQLTPSLLDAPLVLEEDEDGYIRVVEVLAEAIQAQPKGAVEEAWPVTVDGNGRLTEKVQAAP